MRKQEQEFFDQLSQDGGKLQFYKELNELSFQQPFMEYVDALLGDLAGQRALDFGCGKYADMSYKLAAAGATVVAGDISLESVKRPKFIILWHGYRKRVKFLKLDCERLCFRDQTFDLIIGRAILHHLNLDLAAGEIRRVLKPGGRAIFIEPLGMNPLLNLYRRLTPNRRTSDEHPIKFSDFNLLAQYLPEILHKEFNLLSMLAFGLASFYQNKRVLKKILSVLTRADNWLFKHFPVLTRFAWTTVIVMSL